MPPKRRPKHKPICLCRYYGCENDTFVDEVTGDIHKGRQISRQTFSNHRKKNEEWEAQQNDMAPPGSGPHSSLQDVGGILPTSVPPPLARERAIERSTTPTQAMVVDGAQGGNTGPWIMTTLPDKPSIAQLQLAIKYLVDLIAAWLFIVCGLSRTAGVALMKLIHNLIVLSIQVGYLSAQQQLNLTSGEAYFTTTIDARTAINHLSIEPVLKRSVHCPSCFKWYNGVTFPMFCSFRETPRSHICATRLISEVATWRGTRKIPRRLYTTQDFKSWLEFFLSRPGIEDLIAKSHAHQPNPHVMVSIWDSPAWQSIRTEDDLPFCMQIGTLTFSFYIDWFNPLLNKVAGQVVSSGAIVFYCLNLPYDLQGLPENVFLAGITPAPREPTMTSVTHLLDPIVDLFVEMWAGAIIHTYLHPEGTFYRVGVLPGIGDLPGMRKAFGRAGVGSHRHLCTMCKIHKSQIDDLGTSFPPHTSQGVVDAARKWKNATTQKERKKVFDETGVRWSPMLRLTYRDPVKHTMLGVMHNWIEGVIQHHVRVLWSLGIPAGIALAVAASQSKRRASQSSTGATGTLNLFSVAQGGFAMDIDQSDGSTDSDESHHSVIASDMESGGEAAELELVDEEPAPRGIETFTASQLAAIRLCITDAVIPSWIDRPPTNLGEASHGKLKANEWLVLCTVFFPLILPEIWYDESFHPLLTNFVHLATCTNIVSSHTVTNEYADLYTFHYTQYRQSCLELFPDVNSRPNHHFAMHNGELMKYWGPLTKLSEFTGERLNGTLQKIHTNGRLRDMDFTMLRQLGRRGRLRALIQQQQHESTNGRDVLVPPNGGDEAAAASIFISSLNTLNGHGNTTSSNKTITNAHILPHDVYKLIFSHVNSRRDAPLRRYDDFPHPLDAHIHSHWATPLNNIAIQDRTYTIYSKHRGNACISFSHPDFADLQVGFIQSIWSQQLEGTHRTFLLIQSPVSLSEADSRLNPYASQGLVGLIGLLVYDNVSNDCIIAEPDYIQGHVPFYRRPPGTFGIQDGTLVMLNSLHRNR